jgi:hypothetical protein
MQKMIRVLSVVSLLFLGSLLPATAAQPSRTPIKIQVLESRLVSKVTDVKNEINYYGVLNIKAVIDGETYWLEEDSFVPGVIGHDPVLKPGEYDAAIVKDESKASYEVNRIYQLTLPDGKKVKFSVVGIVGK